MINNVHTDKFNVSPYPLYDRNATVHFGLKETVNGNYIKEYTGNCIAYGYINNGSAILTTSYSLINFEDGSSISTKYVVLYGIEANGIFFYCDEIKGGNQINQTYDNNKYWSDENPVIAGSAYITYPEGMYQFGTDVYQNNLFELHYSTNTSTTYKSTIIYPYSFRNGAGVHCQYQNFNKYVRNHLSIKITNVKLRYDTVKSKSLLNTSITPITYNLNAQFLYDPNGAIIIGLKDIGANNNSGCGTVENNIVKTGHYYLMDGSYLKTFEYKCAVWGIYSVNNNQGYFNTNFAYVSLGTNKVSTVSNSYDQFVVIIGVKLNGKCYRAMNLITKATSTTDKDTNNIPINNTGSINDYDRIKTITSNETVPVISGSCMVSTPENIMSDKTTKVRKTDYWYVFPSTKSATVNSKIQELTFKFDNKDYVIYPYSIRNGSGNHLSIYSMMSYSTEYYLTSPVFLLKLMDCLFEKI